MRTRVYMNKKILFAASEMSPFIKTGGLADVIGSLPIELKNKNVDVKVVIPLYKNISRDNLKYVTKFCVFNDWRSQWANVYCMDYDVDVYFIENEYYFGRSNVYGYYDDYERFAFFSKAFLDLLRLINFKPDVINFNDWQTALGCLYLKEFFSVDNFYRDIKSVFTIHNLQYQGIFSKSILSQILLGSEYFSSDKLEFYGNLNFMKAGLLYSDMITTVSPTYAKEIQTMQYGYGLEGVLKTKKDKLIGILNGLCYKKYNPQADSNIFNFSVQDLSGKNLNKKSLCEEFGLKFDDNIPIISVVSRFAEQKGFDIIYGALEKILSMNVYLIIVGTGDASFENLFVDAQKKFGNNLKVKIVFNEQLAKKIYAGSDIFLMPSKFEPCGLSQIMAMRYGTIPVVRKTGGLSDTVKDFFDSDDGNGFLFEDYDSMALFNAVKKAVDLFHDKSVWSKIVRNAMESDFSWAKSAQKYIQLYESL